MPSDDLRERIAQVLATCQGATTWARMAEAVMTVVQPELDREAETSLRMFDQRKQMAAERYVWQERGDRFRAAWQSARQRAQAYGEGIARLCDDRDSYKEWMEEQGERANRAEQELSTVRTALEALTAQSATALAKRDRAKQRARIAEAELETLRAGLRELGGDPTQVQNLYAQLSSRTRQWKAAEAVLQAVREAGSLGEALAAVAKHDGLTRDLITDQSTTKESLS